MMSGRDGRSFDRLLGEMADDVYPLLQQQTTDAGRPTRIDLSNEAIEGLMDAAREDPALGGMWDDQGEPRAFWTTIGGRGPLDPQRTLEALANAAFAEVWWRGRETQPAFSNQLMSNVELLRRLVRGEAADAVVEVQGWTVVLPDGTSLDTPWGVLRSVSDRDRVLFEDSHEGMPQASSIFEVEVEQSWRQRTSLADESWPSDFEKRLKGSFKTHESERLRLAVLLAQADDKLSAPTAVWASAFGRVQAIGGGSATRLSAGPVRLDASALRRVEEWSRLLDDGDLSHLDVALDRTLAAAGNRLPVDALIDAVVVWEALFAHAEGELTFRISCAMAKLLSDSDARVAKQDAIKKLYKKRSRIVHGKTPPNKREALGWSKEALQLTVATWRALLRERADLLNNPDRALTLILE